MPTTDIVGMEWPVGKIGWREYRRTGGNLRWAIDREWVKDGSGQWRKRGHHRRDLPPLNEADYGRWKAARAEARRSKAERSSAGVVSVREVAVE